MNTHVISMHNLGNKYKALGILQVEKHWAEIKANAITRKLCISAHF